MISSTDPGLPPNQPGTYRVKFEFDRYMNAHPGIGVTYEYNGVRHALAPGQAYDAPRSPVLERLLLFKEVDFRRPKVCTH